MKWKNRTINTHESVKEQIKALNTLGLFNKPIESDEKIKTPTITLYGSNKKHWLSHEIIKKTENTNTVISFDNHTDAYSGELNMETHIYHTINIHNEMRGILYGYSAMKGVNKEIITRITGIEAYERKRKEKLLNAIKKTNDNTAITIDLDVLISTPYELTSEATTDYSQQQLIPEVMAITLDELLTAIKIVTDNKKVISVDICGHKETEIDNRTILSIASIIHLLEKNETLNYNKIMDLIRGYEPGLFNKKEYKTVYKHQEELKRVYQLLKPEKTLETIKNKLDKKLK